MRSLYASTRHRAPGSDGPGRGSRGWRWSPSARHGGAARATTAPVGVRHASGRRRCRTRADGPGRTTRRVEEVPDERVDSSWRTRTTGPVQLTTAPNRTRRSPARRLDRAGGGVGGPHATGHDGQLTGRQHGSRCDGRRTAPCGGGAPPTGAGRAGAVGCARHSASRPTGSSVWGRNASTTGPHPPAPVRGRPGPGEQRPRRGSGRWIESASGDRDARGAAARQQPVPGGGDRSGDARRRAGSGRRRPR